MKKIISILLVAMLCFSFTGCTKKTTVNVSASPKLLADTKFPMIYGLDYGMSKNEVFSILGVKESNATEKDKNVEVSSKIKGESYLFDNVTINNMSCSVNLFFLNNGSNPSEIKNGGLYYIIFIANDSEKSKVENELKAANYKYEKSGTASDGTSELGRWNNELTIKKYCELQSYDYDKYIAFCAKVFGLPEEQIKKTYAQEQSLSNIPMTTVPSDKKFRLEFNGLNIILLNASQK